MYLGEGSPFPPTSEVRMLFSQPDGETLEEGDLFRNPEYAHTLQLIAQQGPRALLEGQIAADIVKATHQSPLPGTMTLKDLGSYRAESGDALCRPYRGYSVCALPLPSSGVALLQMLAILDHTDIATRGPQDPQAWFLFAQATAWMYADRDRYVGDPHFVPVPVERMLDPAYVRLRAQLIGDRAGRLRCLRGDRAAARPRPDCRVARHEPLRRRGRRRRRRRVDYHHGGVGIRLRPHRRRLRAQSSARRFLLRAGRGRRGVIANAVRGGKRPRSSMAPIIVLDHAGDFRGGARLPRRLGDPRVQRQDAGRTARLEDVAQEGDRAAQLVAHARQLAARWRGVPAGGARRTARARGIELKSGHAENSGLHGVVRRADGTYEGAADSRREGEARACRCRRRQRLRRRGLTLTPGDACRSRTAYAPGAPSVRAEAALQKRVVSAAQRVHWVRTRSG